VDINPELGGTETSGAMCSSSEEVDEFDSVVERDLLHSLYLARFGLDDVSREDVVEVGLAFFS